jgi:ATP-binding cassette subfamily F protein uup
LELDGSRRLSELSGGWRRRVALAECLAAEPDILLLDEPTNHLDVETIEWLEDSLKQFKGALLLISHDRAFIDAVVSKIWEVDRGILSEFPAPYDAYVEVKERQLADEAKTQAEFDKRLAKEEQWIRQGIKARRTRNEGRVRALKRMRQQHAERRVRQSTAKLNVKSGGQSGKRVATLDNVTLKRGDKVLFSGLTTQIIKGDKVGILGPNGCGKSSLIKMLLGELQPSEGGVELGTQLTIAYFDQTRSTINPNLSIFENVGEGRDFLEVNGEKRHVISYLSDYGFGPERMQTPASALSGGEISRLVLAKLFTKAANLLILDEPTNDLDIETLELLESQLVEFNGTVILISHDRRFLDNVVTSLLVFDEPGKLVEIEGGYSDYLRYRAQKVPDIEEKAAVKSKSADTTTAPAVKSRSGSTKLSYKYQRELELLPQELEQLEEDISALEAQTQAVDFAQKSPDEMQQIFQRLADLQQQLEQKLDRWEELESMKSGG